MWTSVSRLGDEAAGRHAHSIQRGNTLLGCRGKSGERGGCGEKYLIWIQRLSSMKSRNKHNVVLVLQLVIQLSLRFRKHIKYSISKHMYKTKEKYQCLPTQICKLLLRSLWDPINDQLFISSTPCAESCNWISGFKLKRLDCVCM